VYKNYYLWESDILSRKRSRKSLFEISEQPELWIFSNILAEPWIAKKELNLPFFMKEVNIPVSLPSGTCILKVETDGAQGKVISIVIAHQSKIQLFQLMNPSDYPQFQKKVLNYFKEIYPENFDFYSYFKTFYSSKFRELGIQALIGNDTEIKDLSDYGIKSRILQHIADPIQGYEVPQYWRINEQLVSNPTINPEHKELIRNLRVRICDRLAKHAVIEGLRCAILALKHYADLLDSLTSEKQIKPVEEYQTLADGLYELGEYQNSAIFYSKCLSTSAFSSESDSSHILIALKDSIERMKPQEFLEYALFAAKIAQSYERE